MRTSNAISSAQLSGAAAQDNSGQPYDLTCASDPEMLHSSDVRGGMIMRYVAGLSIAVTFLLVAVDLDCARAFNGERMQCWLGRVTGWPCNADMTAFITTLAVAAWVASLAAWVVYRARRGP